MLAPPPDRLYVLVTGVDAALARDVVRLLAEDGASVIAADPNVDALYRLGRDVGPFRAEIEVAQVDLESPRDVAVWKSTLVQFNRLPQLMICCCGAPAYHLGPSAHRARAAPPDDVALSERSDSGCLATVAEQVLRPALFLHAEPLRRSAFNRALAVLRHPTLRGVLERAPARRLFNPSSAIPDVRIASHLYALRRHIDGQPPVTRRIRLAPPSNPPSRRANAA
jgi:NAD(P)-dependent dehydrogenase (short-subunit alcohol dehydrogenase family)